MNREADSGKAPGAGLLLLELGEMRRKYRPGEKISYSGLKVHVDGRDVTDEATFCPEPGSAFPADRKELEVSVSWNGVGTTFTLYRKVGRLVPALICLLVAVAAAGAGTAWWLMNRIPQPEAGTYLIPQGDMSDEEAQALVNEMAERSRITVNIASRMAVREGRIRVNLIVPDGNNGLSERIEVTQGGRLVAKSGVVAPGNGVEWLDATGAEEGPAEATIYAVATDGADSGNPISVEVEIEKR